MQTICIVLHWIVWRMEESRFSLSIIQKNVRLHFIEWWESFFSTTNEWKMWSKWMTKFMILKLIGSDVRCYTIIVIILTSSFEMDTQTCLSCKRAIIFTQQIKLTLKIKYLLKKINGKHGNSTYRTLESNVTVNWTPRFANNYLWSQNSAYWSQSKRRGFKSHQKIHLWKTIHSIRTRWLLKTAVMSEVSSVQNMRISCLGRRQSRRPHWIRFAPKKTTHTHIHSKHWYWHIFQALCKAFKFLLEHTVLIG